MLAALIGTALLLQAPNCYCIAAWSSRVSVKINSVGQGESLGVSSEGRTLAGLTGPAVGASFLATDEQQVQAWQLQGLQLSSHFVSAAKSAPISDATRALLQTFRICATCKKFQRFGERDDGGYLLCMDDLQAQPNQGARGLKAAISMGIADHDRWTLDVVSALQVPVYQSDCTVKAAPSCKDCHFQPKCLSQEKASKSVVNIPEVYNFEAHRTWTMPEALKANGLEHTADRSLLLKMDIEGREWSVFEAASDAWLQKFQQIILEVHFLKLVHMHPHYLASMQRLLKNGFLVAHLHGNNIDADGSVKMGDYHIPNVLEITFISGASHAGTCLHQEQRLPLDGRNDPKKPELPLAELPL